MRMKVVLACLPFFNHVFTPPLPLAYLKAYLWQDKDIEVKALDLETYYFRSSLINQNSSLYWDKIWNRHCSIKDEILDEFVQIILSEGPSIVGFSCAHSNFLSTRYVSKQIKKINPGIYIIYGGRYFCLRQPWRYQVAEWHKSFPDVDAIVKNEGEATLRELIETLKKGIKPTFCKGATIRREEQIIDGGARCLIENLDSIPFPDFKDFSKENYLADHIRILFSRGCVGQCVYCVENDTMGTFRNRSAQNVIDELKLRVRQGYRKFQVCDLTLNSRIDRVIEICRLIIKENLDIEFTFSEFRNAPHLTRDVFGLLYQAGFRTICFGTESGSQAILNRMTKGVKVETIEKNFHDAHQEKLKVILYLMVGFPGETEETFLETINMVRRNKNLINGITAINPTEICWGSRIHDNLDKYDVDKTSLLKFQDTWKSKEGNNCLQWRRSLAARMQQYFESLGIPMVNFVFDGNPIVPARAVQKFDYRKKVKKYMEKNFRQRDNEKFKLILEYAASLTIREKYIDASNNRDIMFLLEIMNIAQKEWRRLDFDNWIRAGCRIYNEQQCDNLPITELRQELPKDIKRGERFQILFRIAEESLPKGKYQLKFDMVNERQFWFEDLGSIPLIEHIEL